ncbi:MAG TPA: cytochrome c biogenesis protein CcdA [Bacteroidales bacterium]|nr:cytochrome c biogenesis protein CcdA [Bacteroidales bacterium]HSA44419.1 cytochrome c biogenesis protein CcdA [Bacteroidales bacterium]
MAEQWISELSAGSHNPLSLLTASLLGFLGLATSCCTVPVLTAVAGYSGSMTGSGKKYLLISSFFFLLGVIFTLLLTGIAVSLSGQMLFSATGGYWKLITGCLFVFFGLSTTGLINVKLSPLKPIQGKWRPGVWTSVLFGIALASSSAVCNSLCNPVFSIALGAAFIHNNIAWGTLIMLFFSLGFGFPLAIGMAGMSVGVNQASQRFERISLPVKYTGGILLLATGFYYLITF